MHFNKKQNVPAFVNLHISPMIRSVQITTGRKEFCLGRLSPQNSPVAMGLLVDNAFFNPSCPAQATIVAGTLLAITCQLLELESCSNPLRIEQVF